MDGRVAYTSALSYDAKAGAMSVRAQTGGEAVVLASIEVWELGSCWVNERTALQMIG